MDNSNNGGLKKKMKRRDEDMSLTMMYKEKFHNKVVQ